MLSESILLYVEEDFEGHAGRPGIRGGSLPRGVVGARVVSPLRAGATSKSVKADIHRLEKVATNVIKEHGMEEEVRLIRRNVDDAPQTRDVYSHNGVYVPERQARHDKIVADTLAQATPVANPTFVFTGGVPGAGKSTMLRNVDLSNHVIVEHDAFKAALPEYKGWNAANVLSEASDITAKVMRIAIEQHKNVVYDGTMSNFRVNDALLKEVKALGYKVKIYFMDTQPEMAMQRALGRYKNPPPGQPGRFVDPVFIAQEDHKNIRTFNRLKSSADSYQRYDANGHLVEQGGKYA